MLATNAAWRAEVVPSPPPESPETAKARRAKRLTRHPRMRLAGERPSWSDLLQRVFRVDGFACPGCGGAFALRCVVVNPPATRRILDGLRRATGPPGLDLAGNDRRGRAGARMEDTGFNFPIRPRRPGARAPARVHAADLPPRAPS